MRSYLWIVLAGLLCGCSTLSETFSEPSRCPGGLVYCGTQVDALLLSAAADQDAGILRALWPIALIDLPFSLVADTLILPYTLYQDATAEHSASAP